MSSDRPPSGSGATLRIPRGLWKSPLPRPSAPTSAAGRAASTTFDAPAAPTAATDRAASATFDATAAPTASADPAAPTSSAARILQTTAANRTAPTSSAPTPSVPRRNPTRQASEKGLRASSRHQPSIGAKAKKGEVPQSIVADNVVPNTSVSFPAEEDTENVTQTSIINMEASKRSAVLQSHKDGGKSDKDELRCSIDLGTSRKPYTVQSQSGANVNKENITHMSTIGMETSKRSAVLQSHKDSGKSDEDELRYIIDMGTSCKPSTIQSLSGANANKFPMKLKTIIARNEKIRSMKINKAKADLARMIEGINAEYSSALMADVIKAMSSCDVALVCHDKMLGHFPPQGHTAKEKPERLSMIMKELRDSKIIDRCQIFKACSATSNDLCLAHAPDHVKEVIDLSSTLAANVKASMYKSDKDMYFSSGTTEAILHAAGGAIQACDLVLTGAFLYSFAIVRPPGHHASWDEGPYGFCYVNNIAIAIKHALNNHHKERILVVDWDIHHGNGTQNIFYNDKRVLFFSVHRFDSEDFFPPTLDGALDKIGVGVGEGYNLNVCWSHTKIRDTDYVAVWEHILLPLIREFDPEVIFVSAGFDAVKDDLGGCEVTPDCYAYLLQKLMLYPVVMVLEGGYELPALSKSVIACVKALLGDKCQKLNSRNQPFDTTWTMIKETRAEFKRFWKCFEDEIPENVTAKCKKASSLKCGV